MSKKARDIKKAARVARIVEIKGVKKNYVYKVLRDERESEEILGLYMEMIEDEKETDNRLMQEVKRVAPFNKD